MGEVGGAWQVEEAAMSPLTFTASWSTIFFMTEACYGAGDTEARGV